MLVLKLTAHFFPCPSDWINVSTSDLNGFSSGEFYINTDGDGVALADKNRSMNLFFHFVALMFWHSILFLGIREGIGPSALEQHGQFL